MYEPLDDEPFNDEPLNRVQFLNMGAFVEGGVILLALFLAWVFDVDWQAFLHWDMKAAAWSMGGLLPMLLLFFFLHRFPIGSMLKVKRFLIDVLGPSLSTCRWYELLILAGLAGLSEELLFRGVLQPWFENIGGETAGHSLGVIGSNILFGLVHAVTITYAILASLMGIYLSLLLDISGERNLIIPVIVHALYDFVAFLVISKTYRNEQL
ncbi:hypothetical protein MNBD_PLANCTO02-1873 [hydrothermal vent metagenome]|uniref:CAAX prenyl protease 2/Lysostaphin resistance protein A-like domain-containing protein n=1 Tax=hydrothermal vent metagenome TaxID=652676 RepID=A0A3B1CYH7_9ZZZZ